MDRGEIIMEKTLAIIKPDATRRNVTGTINQIIESSGLRIIAQKRIKLSQNQAEGFYSVHKERPFYQDLVSFISSNPVVVLALKAENAISRYRTLMGATNPADADEGTIRALFASSIDENAVHYYHCSELKPELKPNLSSTWCHRIRINFDIA